MDKDDDRGLERAKLRSAVDGSKAGAAEAMEGVSPFRTPGTMKFYPAKVVATVRQ